MSKAMKDGKKGLVPALRFPEVREAGEWTTRKLEQVAQLLTEKAGNRKFTLMSVTAGIGLVSQLEKFGREIAGAQYKNYFVIRNNDFAYNKSATKDYPEGFIALYEGDTQAAVPNSIFTCFRVETDEVIPRFLNYQFLNNLHGRWLCKFITIGARAHGSLNIDNKDLLALPVPMPMGDSAIQEQQKIADCLSSLDALITAQADKIHALKTHKKGLMQQLFPREGETVPRLRFPEFRDTGEWDIKPLRKIAQNLDSKRVPITEADRIKGAIPYYGASGIIDYVEGYIFDEDLLCISEDGANLVARTYPIAFSISGKTWVNNHAHVLRFDHRFTQTIIENYLNAKNIEDFLTGMAQPKLNRAKLDTIPVPLPEKDEQQKIADCLSSLDALITAHAEKLEALKSHKKGLMQQLFPSPDDCMDAGGRATQDAKAGVVGA